MPAKDTTRTAFERDTEVLMAGQVLWGVSSSGDECKVYFRCEQNVDDSSAVKDYSPSAIRGSPLSFCTLLWVFKTRSA
jgi:hypothetical protein